MRTDRNRSRWKGPRRDSALSTKNQDWTQIRNEITKMLESQLRNQHNNNKRRRRRRRRKKKKKMMMMMMMVMMMRMTGYQLVSL